MNSAASRLRASRQCSVSPAHVVAPPILRPTVRRASLQRPQVQRPQVQVRSATTDRPSDNKSKSISSVLGSMEDKLYDTSMPLCGEDEDSECLLVDFVMRTLDDGVLTAKPSESLENIIPRLDKVTGMPVLGDDGKIVGVISRKDIIKVRKAMGSMKDTVAQHMTSPALTIETGSTIQDAGDLMLTRKIRRLPVVDSKGYPIGIIARSDIFKPLMMDAYKTFMELEIKALHGDDMVAAEKARTTKKAVSWTLKYLYDGDCPMCMSLKTMLERQDNQRGIIKFVNIADPDFKPTSNMGISYEEAMETIHVIKSDGSVIMGTDALRALFESVGLGWAIRLSELPVIAWLVDVVYEFLSANRLALGSMGGLLDGVIASKRISMSQQGVQTCGDVDEECSVEW